MESKNRPPSILTSDSRVSFSGGGGGLVYPSPPLNASFPSKKYEEQNNIQYIPVWKGPRDAPVLCVIAQFTVLLFHEVLLQTTLHCRLPPSQQYDRRQMEHEGSLSPHAMEPLATGLQVRAWTDTTLVQRRNTFVVYFLAFTVRCGRRC